MSNDVTRILNAIEQGDQAATEELLPIVYQELRRLATQKLSRQKTGQSIQPTMLVHEAYVRLVDVDHPQQWNSRGHFFGAAAEAMRRILVEHARTKRSAKHGGGHQRVNVNLETMSAEAPTDNILALNDVLMEFENLWPDKANLVKLRYFCGLTIPEAAKAIGISTATAERYWRFAKAWLHAQINTET